MDALAPRLASQSVLPQMCLEELPTTALCTSQVSGNLGNGLWIVDFELPCLIRGYLKFGGGALMGLPGCPISEKNLNLIMGSTSKPGLCIKKAWTNTPEMIPAHSLTTSIIGWFLNTLPLRWALLQRHLDMIWYDYIIRIPKLHSDNHCHRYSLYNNIPRIQTHIDFPKCIFETFKDPYKWDTWVNIWRYWAYLHYTAYIILPHYSRYLESPANIWITYNNLAATSLDWWFSHWGLGVTCGNCNSQNSLISQQWIIPLYPYCNVYIMNW